MPWPLLGWKAMLVAIDLLSCLVLLRLARARGAPAGRVIAYAWNPLVVLEVAGMGHVDALGVLPLLVAALFLVEPQPKHAAIARRRSAAAGAALALAILAKLVPLLLVPAWTRASARRVLFVAACGALLAVVAVPFAIGAPGFPPGLVTYAVSWEWNGPVFEPLWRALDWAGAVPWTKARLDDLKAATGHHELWNPLYHYVYPQLLAKVVLAIAMAGVVIASLRRADPIDAALTVLGGVLVLSATVYPWYALWMLPLAALQWSVPWLVLSLSLLASYLPRFLDVPLLPWPFLLIWGPFVIALLMTRR
ncbi:MAG TPA: hypothetical protein VHR17_05075 [Thermoanaerobaculia bacterium]|nr:hypothetical protein [Thermoanaerobaculia bacterium]